MPQPNTVWNAGHLNKFPVCDQVPEYLRVDKSDELEYSRLALNDVLGPKAVPSVMTGVPIAYAYGPGAVLMPTIARTYANSASFSTSDVPYNYLMTSQTSHI